MADEPQKKRKRAIATTILVGLVLLFGLGGGHLGLFSSVALTETTRGPYTIVGAEYIGTYRKNFKRHKAVSRNLVGIELSRPCSVLYDVPGQVKRKKRRSLVGYIVADGGALPKSAVVERIPQRTVLVASLSAHPSLAFLKTFAKAKRWFKQESMQIDGPMIELYLADGSVELEVPIGR